MQGQARWQDDGSDDLDAGQGMAVPDGTWKVETVGHGPIADAVAATVATLLTGLALTLVGTVRTVTLLRRRRAGPPTVVSREERQAAAAMAQAASRAGLEQWTWASPATFESLRVLDPEAVAFWTDDEPDDVGRWQRGEPGYDLPDAAERPSDAPVRA